MELQNITGSPALEIHLLGRFEVYVYGDQVSETEIKGRKARSLLKILSHQRNYQMVRDHLTELLWPDLDGTSANSQLYKALHHIRKAFSEKAEEGADWIEMSDDLIRICPPEGLVIDVQRFEDLARKGLQQNSISVLEKAASVYSGDFLPMDRYVEWASLPRRHYRQLYLDILTTLGSQYEDKGDFSEGAEMYRMALDIEPTLEIGHQGLMRIFARKGQSTRAFHQYDLCREVLREELGMSPSDKTRETLDIIREGKLLEKEGKSTARTKVSGPEPPIIGRRRECITIDQMLDDVNTGRGGGMIISVEAGIGKTRLIRELILRARRRNLSFYMGSSAIESGKIAYGPFIEIFEEILRVQPELGSLLPVEIGQLVPGFTGNGQSMPHADKLAAKGFLFAQVHRFLSKLTEKGPVVFILEDLHAADKGTIELFSYLIQHRGNLPLLYVATLRKEEAEPVPEFVQNLKDHSIGTIELAPLSYNEHVQLLHSRLLGVEESAISAETVRHIYQLAEGNPFYALELMRHYTEKGEPGPEESQKYSETFSTAPLTEKIPVSIQHMVEQKLENLSKSAHRLLVISAVIGKEVSYEILASIWMSGSSNDEEELFISVEEVIRAGLLEEQGLDYSFRHALVQETIYGSISEARRRTLHKQIAGQLLELSDDELVLAEKISWHYLEAGELMQGAEYLLKAGEQAENVYAHDDALLHFHKAVEALEGLDHDKTGALPGDLYERIGDVYRACGKLEKSFDAYEKAISLAEEIPSFSQDLVELHRKVAVVAILRTEIDRSEIHLQKAFDKLKGEPKKEARLLITKALHLWHLNQLQEAYEVAQKALSLAKNVNAKAEASQACEILAMTCLPLGRWEEGLKYEQERQIYGWSPEVVVATDAHLCLWEYHVSGDQPFRQAQSFMEQVSEQASQVGDLRCVAVCHYALGTMHLWRGNRRHAVEELASSLDLHQRVGSPAGMAYSLARKSVLHTLMGAYELGWQSVQEGIEYAKQAAVRDHCMQRLYGVGIWNRIEAGEPERAKIIIEKSEQLLDESGACAACALELYPWMAFYFLNENQVGKARESGNKISELAEMTGNPIGKAISAMIESSLSLLGNDKENSKRYKKKSWQILEETVPETSYSPVAHFLNRMDEQQQKMNALQ